MSTRIDAYANRTVDDITGEISAGDGESVPAALGAADVLKWRLTNYRGDLIIELVSDIESDNGSLLAIEELGDGATQKPEWSLILNEDDMTFGLGMFRWELIWIEDGTPDLTKRIDIGTLYVTRSAPEPEA